MFEMIGIIAVWLAGAATAFYAPLIAGMVWRGGLETIVVGYWAAKACLAAYLALTLIYFIVT